jgi:hypothetical protein
VEQHKLNEFFISSMLNTKGQHNKSFKPNAYRCDFQPHYASKGFGKLTYLAGLASA